jgi:hypothetical protein
MNVQLRMETYVRSVLQDGFLLMMASLVVLLTLILIKLEPIVTQEILDIHAYKAMVLVVIKQLDKIVSMRQFKLV